MPRQTSFQATEATQTQLAALRRAGYGTTTDIIRIAIDRMYREEKETMSTRPIYLSESNAGHLLVGNAAVGWHDFTHAAAGVNFEDIAMALINGDTDDWAIDHFDHDNQFEDDIVAEYTPSTGTKIVTKYLGTAARQWLHLEEA